MNRPIPIKDLPHSAIYSTITSDEFGNKTSIDIPLTRVRFESTKKTMLSSLGEGKDDKFLMFFDIKNSRPLNQEFTKLDKITFNGVSLTMREIIPEYERVLHHYEIMLN